MCTYVGEGARKGLQQGQVLKQWQRPINSRQTNVRNMIIMCVHVNLLGARPEMTAQTINPLLTPKHSKRASLYPWFSSAFINIITILSINILHCRYGTDVRTLLHRAIVYTGIYPSVSLLRFSPAFKAYTGLARAAYIHRIYSISTYIYGSGQF